MALPLWFWAIVAFLFGICIGSFLNVVIYRLPIARPGLTLSVPTWSFCPNCRRRLTAIDLVPLFSFLLLGRRCRGCKTPISWRYFGVELLTGVLYVVLTLFFQQNVADLIAMLLLVTVLIPIYFIDFERFEIPDTLNILATLIPVGRDVLGIVQHEPGHALMWGWMPRSVLGALVGMAIFGGVRVAGWLWKGVEAMGLGDVLLARGMGAMLAILVIVGGHPLRLFPVWVLLSCLSGIFVGVPLIIYRAKQEEKQRAGTNHSPEPVEENEQAFVREGTLLDQIKAVAYCVFLIDMLEYLMRKTVGRKEPYVEPEPDDWTPAPTAIPFGPFMVIGFLCAVFIGEWITAAYLNYAFPPIK